MEYTNCRKMQNMNEKRKGKEKEKEEEQGRGTESKDNKGKGKIGKEGNYRTRKGGQRIGEGKGGRKGRRGL